MVHHTLMDSYTLANVCTGSYIPHLSISILRIRSDTVKRWHQVCRFTEPNSPFYRVQVNPGLSIFSCSSDTTTHSLCQQTMNTTNFVTTQPLVVAYQILCSTHIFPKHRTKNKIAATILVTPRATNAGSKYSIPSLLQA